MILLSTRYPYLERFLKACISNTALMEAWDTKGLNKHRNPTWSHFSKLAAACLSGCTVLSLWTTSPNDWGCASLDKPTIISKLLDGIRGR